MNSTILPERIRAASRGEQAVVQAEAARPQLRIVGGD